MTSQAVKDAHQVNVHEYHVQCMCGWSVAIKSVDEAKHMARMHWAFVEETR